MKNPVPTKVFRLDRIVWIIALLILLANYLIMHLFIGNTEFLMAFSDIYLAIVDGLVFTALYFTYRATSVEEKRERRFWLFLLTAKGCYLIADFIWFFIEIIFTGQPFPSIADLFFLLYYPLIATALLFFPSAPIRPSERWKLSLEMGGIMLGTMLVFWTFLFGPNLDVGITDSLTLGVSLAYPAADLALLWALIGLIFRSRTHQYKNVILLIIFSTVTLVISDSVFGFQSVMGVYQSGGVMDTGWTASSLLMGLAALNRGFQLGASREQILPEAAEQESSLPAWTSYAPYLGLVLAYALLIWDHFYKLPISFWGLIGGIGGIIAIILMRQIIAINENRKLYIDAQKEVDRRRKAEGLLLNAYDEVEARVILRTQELASANEKLKFEITERESAQQVLYSTQAKLEHLLTSNPGVIYSCEPSGDFAATFISKNVFQQLGYYSKDFLEDPSFWMNHIHPQDRTRVIESIQKISNQGSCVNEYRLCDKDGIWRWFQDSVRLNLDDKNNPSEMVGLMVDITDRKQMEEQLRSSLLEKETLLKEIHHRVKNNLQVISSLLSLQSEKVKGEDARHAFKESQLRISSMSLIHERLYRSSDLSKINFGEYIRSLITSLVRSYGGRATNIHLQFSVEDIHMNIDKAMPCGLIVNELISNCIKYAFPEELRLIREPEIKVILMRTENDGCLLEIQDNGIGLPQSLDISHIESLGLQLVTTLVSQLDGTLTIDSVLGLKFLIQFSMGPS